MLNPDKVSLAVEKYLGHQGCEYIGEIDDIVIFLEDGMLVFAPLSSGEDFPPEDEKPNRQEMEKFACYFMREYDFDYVGEIRFDKIDIVAASQGKALLRHTKNVLITN